VPLTVTLTLTLTVSLQRLLSRFLSIQFKHSRCTREILLCALWW